MLKIYFFFLFFILLLADDEEKYRGPYEEPIEDTEKFILDV